MAAQAQLVGEHGAIDPRAVDPVSVPAE
jgi:hypothetical protein